MPVNYGNNKGIHTYTILYTIVVKSEIRENCTECYLPNGYSQMMRSGVKFCFLLRIFQHFLVYNERVLF